MLELIPDMHAWVKDRQGRFIFGNLLFYSRFGFETMQGLIGKTDYDIAPVDMAQRYRRDDEHVLEGAVVTDRLELIRSAKDEVEWFLTSKTPIYTEDGKVIGSLGISRHLNRTERKAVPFRELHAPIDYIAQHFASDISVESLARACNLSISALERRFKKHLGKSPNQYLNQVRLDHARGLLKETDKPIGTIAMETGYSDHSYFTRIFIRHAGMTPSEYRNRDTG